MMQISLSHWRNSQSIRIVSFLILLNFLTSQTLFAQEQFQLKEGTHLYTPVKEMSAERLDEKGTGSEILPSTTTASLPVPFFVSVDFTSNSLMVKNGAYGF